MKFIEVSVVKPFLDRPTGKMRKIGEKMTVTDERLREIKRSGEYVKIEVKAPDTKPEDKKK